MNAKGDYVSGKRGEGGSHGEEEGASGSNGGPRSLCAPTHTSCYKSCAMIGSGRHCPGNTLPTYAHAILALPRSTSFLLWLHPYLGCH